MAENQAQDGSNSDDNTQDKNQTTGNESNTQTDANNDNTPNKPEDSTSDKDKDKSGDKGSDDKSGDSTDPKLAQNFDALKGVVSGQQKKINDMLKELESAKVKEAIFESTYPDFIKTELKNNVSSLTLEEVKIQGDKLLSIYDKGKQDGQGSVNRMINNRPDKSGDKDFEAKAIEGIKSAKSLEDIQKAIRDS